jgi:hypothetical protein
MGLDLATQRASAKSKTSARQLRASAQPAREGRISNASALAARRPGREVPQGGSCAVSSALLRGVPQCTVFRNLPEPGVLMFCNISSVFKKLPESPRVGRAPESTWPNFSLEGV